MKRKFKIMQHQIEQLKEEISAKDLALVKEHFDHMKVRRGCAAETNIKLGCTGFCSGECHWKQAGCVALNANTRKHTHILMHAHTHTHIHSHAHTCPHMHAQVEKEKEALRMELNKAKQQIKEADTAIGSQKAEIEKLNHIINEADQERIRQKKEYDIVVNERDILGTQVGPVVAGLG